MFDLSKKVQVPVAWLLAFALLLCAGLYDVHLANKKLAKAERDETAYHQLADANKRTLDADAADRKAKDAQIAKLQSGMDERDKATAAKVADVTAPKSQDEVAKDAQDVLNVTPEKDGEKLAFDLHTVQSLIALKLENDTLTKDNADLKAAFAAQLSETSTLKRDLTTVQGQLKASEALTKEYKSAAKAGRIKRFFKGAGTVTAIGGAAYLGYLAGHKK